MKRTLSTCEQGSLEWKRQRKQAFITASEASGLFDLGFKSMWDLWKSKVCPPVPEEMSYSQLAAMSHGSYWEDTARRHYELWRGGGHKPKRVEQFGFGMLDCEGLIMGASPDGIMLEDEEKKTLLEIKCPHSLWKKAFTGNRTNINVRLIPLYYLPQLIVGMEVLDCDRVHYVSFVPLTDAGGDFVVFELDRRDTQKAWEMILDHATTLKIHASIGQPPGEYEQIKKQFHEELKRVQDSAKCIKQGGSWSEFIPLTK